MSDANVNTLDNQGNTALLHACYHGHMDIATTLVRHGADVNLGKTKPLTFAVAEGHNEIAEWLLLNGKNVSVALLAWPVDFHLSIRLCCWLRGIPRYIIFRGTFGHYHFPLFEKL